MNIIKVDCLPLSIFVGYERENDARGVTFDYSAWAEQYGDGVLQLLVQRPGDADPYPVVLTAGENNTAVWLLSATDTAVKGQIEIQLIFTVGSVVAKTAVLPVLLDRSLAAGATPPDPYETWLETLTELAEQILHTTQPPEIRNGYWYIFDPDTGEYVNSGVKAEGEDGVGITGAQLNADYTLTLNFSNGTSYTTPSIRGAQGAPGPTPQLSIGTVTTGAAGSSAAVEISGTPEAPVLNFTIPRGNTGEVSEAELQAALLDKADVITDTASGAIASFPDGAAAPVKALTVAVEPVQDLHGYDAPWPAGGGKNKFNGAAVTTTHTGNWGVSWDEATQKLTIEHKNTYYTGTPSLELSLPVGTYTVKCASATGAFQINKDGQYLIQCDATATQFTVEEGSVYTALFYNANASTFVFEKIQIEAGSTATSYAPYSNLCPISGHIDADVWDDPKYGGLINWNQQFKELSSTDWQESNANYGTAAFSNGECTYTVVTVGTSYTYGFHHKTTKTFGVSGHKYFLSVDCKASRGGVTIGGDVCNKGFTFDGTVGTSYQNFSTILSSTGNQVAYICIRGGTAVGDTLAFKNIMLIDLTEMFGAGNEPSTVSDFKALFPKDYYAYNEGTETCVSAVNGDTYREYTIDLDGTRYGCTLDVTTGVLTVTHGIKLVKYSEGQTLTIDGVFLFRTTINDIKNDTLKRSFICSHFFKPSGYIGQTPSQNGMITNQYFNAYNVCMRNDALTTAGEWQTWLAAQEANGTPVQIVYELATPFEISLTPEEIETLKGTNNFWSDAGDVSVEYRADTKLYIEKKITAAIAAALNS